MAIQFTHKATLTTEQIINLLNHCSLGARRPTNQPECIEKMFKNSDIIISAWDNDRLVGVARSLSDYTYITYLSDLFVDENYQKPGIGKQLIIETQKLCSAECRIVLFAAPNANDYYPRLGFVNNPRGWLLSDPIKQ